ncbi:MAG: hypothetical protein IJ298_04340 [Ruminococcus sp.]|nr:hypothetical protein [Ruminococcus sp.]
MLTVLTIDDRTYGGDLLSALARTLPDRLRVHNLSTPVPVRHLEYIHRRGSINWRRISKAAGDYTGQLLYSGSIPVPQDAGITLFEPLELRQRLCGNMALSVLEMMQEVPKSLRIGLYDPKGEYSDLPEHLLKFTDNLIVVTKNYSVYREQAERLLSEYGAVLCVSPHTALLSTCGFIVSPCCVDKGFTPLSQAVVISGAKPALPLACRVYYRYSFQLEPAFERLKPEGTDTEVFAAGLYSLCGVYSLGSVVPLVCSGDTDTQTTLSLRRYLIDCFGT